MLLVYWKTSGLIEISMCRKNCEYLEGVKQLSLKCKKNES